MSELPMSALRWALLLIGLAFLAGLALWELRRARRHAVARGDRAHEAPPPAADPRAPPVHREPTLTLPEVRVPDPGEQLPVIEIADEIAEEARLELRAEAAPEEDPVALEEGIEPIIPVAPEPAPALAEPASAEALAATGALTEPIVEWPAESVRKIVALRLVASGEKLPGHAVRQALAAEGFVLGKFSIFHRAGADGRALVSAASLTQPGTFQSEAIDLQRYGGLNLFTVLPGSLPPAVAFEELLSTARGLNSRLCGALQDERGEPLTPTRTAAIREMLAAVPAVAEPAARES
jgi:cell division protein ZipA